jgi:hypothetical protein
MIRLSAVRSVFGGEFMSSLSKTVREDLPLLPISPAVPAERKVIRSGDGNANNRPIPSFWNFVEDDHVLARSPTTRRRTVISPNA